MERANDTIVRLRALSCGEVAPVSGATTSAWNEARAMQREVSLSIVERWEAWHEEIEAAPPPPEALCLLGGQRSGGYEHEPGPGAGVAGDKPLQTEGRLSKGAICPFDVERISLPPPGTTPVSLVDVSPTAAAYLRDFKNRMLRRPEEVDWLQYQQQRVFSDEVFTRRAELLRLCERMWLAGMLGYATESHSEVSAFGVVKGYDSEGIMSIRAVWDERKPNILWQEAPFIPLGSPATLCHLDLSGLEQEDVLFSAIGDMPDWFYRLQLPEEMWPWFTVMGVELPDFVHFMEQRGHSLPPAGECRYLAVTVLVMGWSWAPSLAHSALTDLLDGIHGKESIPRRMVYGLPVPQWDTELVDEWSPLTWAYIDDYGALLASRSGDPDQKAEKEIQEWAAKTRAGMKRQGLPVHKEACGVGLDSVLGAALSGRPYTLSIPRRRMALLMQATLGLLELPVVAGKWLEKIIGHWSWGLMLRRMALSILGDTYRWMQEHRAKRAPLPWLVKCELRMLVALGPWMSTNLETPWLRQVFATDASMEGYGVVSTQAKLSEIRSEARLAETKGWTVCLDDDYSDIEESTWSEPAAGYSTDTFEESLSSRPAPEPPEPGRPRVFRVAHLFSGHRRQGDLEWWLRTLASETDIWIEVWSIDVSVDPTLDLTRGDIVTLLSIAFRAGFFHAAVAGPPCSTWSRARFRGGKGPRPLRTREEPWGRTDIVFTDSEKKKLVLGTKLLRACITLFGVLAEEGGVFILEHPRDPGVSPFPSIWDLELTKELRAKSGASLVDLDQCMFGQEAQKGTFILSNAATAARHLERRCCHSKHAVTLTGQNADGSFKTAAAQTYPSGLCRAMAATLLDSLEAMRDTGTGPDAQVRHPNIESLKFPPAVPGRARAERRYGERVPVPPLSGQWLPAKRWSLVYKGLWRQREHITVQEMRTAVGVMRHLARSRHTWNHKVLILMDSMAAMGVISKGRSSSPPLLRLSRQAAAISLVFGIYPMVRYIPSEVNPADGPSRGVAVGAAPETRAAHADRLGHSLQEAMALGRDAPLVDTDSVARLLANARACSGYAGG